jgi:hypothetical protein
MFRPLGHLQVDFKDFVREKLSCTTLSVTDNNIYYLQLGCHPVAVVI